jgi:transposase-like protein
VAAGPVMSGFLTFMDHYRDEAACIVALAELRWPNGFICAKCARCAGRLAYQLAARPRVFECADCGRQHSVTAGTVFHRTGTPLRKWFAAAWLIGQDKRGVSALFLTRELALRVPASPRQGEGIKQSHFVAGSVRVAVLPAATAADLSGFVRGAAKPGARIITDGLKSYDGLADSFRHYSIVQDGGKNADAVLPIVHVLFSNVKTWLNGTFHGVSTKHLPRYAREWNYRFNRRRRIADLTDFLLRRAATRPTITYRQLVDGAQINGALPALTG